MIDVHRKAMNEIFEPLMQAVRCSNLLQLALAGFIHCDQSDEDAVSALRYCADELESHLGLVNATWWQADKEAS